MLHELSSAVGAADLDVVRAYAQGLGQGIFVCFAGSLMWHMVRNLWDSHQCRQLGHDTRTLVTCVRCGQDWECPDCGRTDGGHHSHCGGLT